MSDLFTIPPTPPTELQAARARYEAAEAAYHKASETDDEWPNISREYWRSQDALTLIESRELRKLRA